jgi:hypothetical protein
VVTSAPRAVLPTLAEPIMIQGVAVRFPFRPYPSQIIMMTRILQALKRVCVCVCDDV